MNNDNFLSATVSIGQRSPARIDVERWFRIVLVPLVLIVAVSAGAEVVTVVSPDGPLPSVVAAEGKGHHDAANDLCDYLSRVTGRTTKPDQNSDGARVIIHVGPDAFVLEHAPKVKELNADGYLLKHLAVNGKHHIILSGLRGNSSGWAVEEFLEQFCGVRWLFPDATYGEIVPSRPTVTVPHELDQKHEPHYLNRGNLQMYYYEKTNTNLRRRAEGSLPFGSHAIQDIFVRKDYEAHPEWFSLFTAPDSDLSRFLPGTVGKSRQQRWYWEYGNGWQICMSNPGTVQHAVEYARAYFAKNPESPVVSMGHNDGDGWCECADCARFTNSVNPPYTVSERYWHWVNQVAIELARTHPDKQITTIAYGAPATPPRFQLAKNITVTVTVYVKEHLDLVRQWKERCGSVNLYSYAWGREFVGFRHYPHAMRDFLKWGHDDLGAVSHVSEIYGNWSFDGPKYQYVLALQWDVNADPDQIMKDYCRDWFGAAAEPMRAFWDLLEQVYERRGQERRFLFYQWPGWKEAHDEFDHYTLDDVSALDVSVAEAERKADIDGDRFRVARVADAWKYYRTFLLGKLQYGDQQTTVLAEAARSSDRALELARELAKLQCERQSFLRQLRSYPQMNRWIVTWPNYLSQTFENVSVFCDMRTLLDLLCGQATAMLTKSKGAVQTVAFWQNVERHDPLHQAAQTQLYLIGHPHRPNLLVNGDFEAGDLSGWKVGAKDAMGVTTNAPRNGRHAAQARGTLSQSLPVKPGERHLLTAWGRYPTEPDSKTILFSANINFLSGNKAVSFEPGYRRLRKAGSAKQWVGLEATFTVPLAADTAVISLSSGTPLLWDDLTLEKIKEGPVIEPGVLVDDFSGVDEHPDDARWADAPDGVSGFLPVIKDGWLVFDNRPMATLVGLGSFDGLLSGTGDPRYRLRLHIAKGDVTDRPASVECGIKTGTTPISTSDAGFFLTHSFSVPAEGKDRLDTFWHQDKKFVAGGRFDIDPANRKHRDVWYTVYFDTTNVTLYAGSGGYDESAAAVVGAYEHKMTNITSQGPVFLKLTGGNAKVSEISLMRAPLGKVE